MDIIVWQYDVKAGNNPPLTYDTSTLEEEYNADAIVKPTAVKG